MNEKKNFFGILGALGIIFGFIGLGCEFGSKIPEVKEAMGEFKGNKTAQIEEK